MFEIIVPTTKSTRLDFHRFLADLREVNDLGDAVLQCNPMCNHLHIRSDRPFTGAREVTLPAAGPVTFRLYYSAEANHGRDRKYVVKSDEAIIASIVRTCEAGGLTNIDVCLNSFSFELFDIGKNRRPQKLPVAEISVTATIRDGEQFSKLTSTGIGKRRSYGLGMLLIDRRFYVD